MTPKPSLLALTVRVLRSPESFVEGDRVPLATVVPGLLALVAIAGGLFGVVIGSYRGGIQHLFAAIKLPIVLLLPLLVTLPAILALYRAAGVALRYDRLAFAALVGVTRASLLAAAMGPALWLLYSIRLDYHRAVMSLCGALVIAGFVGLVTVARLLPSGGKLRICAHAASLVVAGVVFAQGGWLLRPFLVRPRAEITFVRPIEADVFSSAAASWSSAKGDYRGWEAERVPMWDSEEGRNAP
jgi:hypothetical protein